MPYSSRHLTGRRSGSTPGAGRLPAGPGQHLFGGISVSRLRDEKVPDKSHSQEDSVIGQVEIIISNILRFGVLLSAAVILVGLLWLIITHHSGYGQDLFGNVARIIAFRDGGAGQFPTALGEVLGGVLALKPYSIIALGLLLLILTPVIRVATSVLAFLYERDYLYVGITLFVLAVLVFGFIMGKGGE